MLGRRSRRLRIAIATVAVLALVAAACGEDEEPTTTTQAATTTAGRTRDDRRPRGDARRCDDDGVVGGYLSGSVGDPVGLGAGVRAWWYLPVGG